MRPSLEGSSDLGDRFVVLVEVVHVLHPLHERFERSAPDLVLQVGGASREGE